MSNCPGVLISELQTMNFVSEEDYIVINDNNKITKRVSYVDFVGSLNQNPNVRLTTYASDVLILSPLSTENPLWLRFAPKYPVNQEEANNYIVNELVRQKDKLVALDVRINELEAQDGNYATKKYVDEQIYIEKTEREGADDVLMNIKADKYNHYTKAEIDQMLQDLVIDAGGLPDAPANGEVYGRQDLMWVRVVEEAIADGKQYVRRNRNWEEIIVPDGVTDLGIDNRDDETLDITSSTGTSVTIPAASTVLAGLMTAADKAALTQAALGTDLGIDNRNANNFELTSSTGEEVIVPAATTTLSGVMTAADKAGLDALIATGGNTDLAVANNTATNLDVTSSTGTDATLPPATETTAGLLTAADKVNLNSLVATGGITNLGVDNRTDSTLDVTSNTGTDATIPAASTTEAGLLTASDKTKLDSVTSGAQPNIDPSQTYLGAPTGGRLTLTPGGDTTDLPVVNSTNAGLMAPGDKVKIDAIEDGAQANVATNLGYTPAALQGTVTSSTGTGAVIPVVDEDDAGLMSPQHLYKLENIDNGAEVNVPTDLEYTAAPDGGLVSSSTGTDATLTVVDDDNAGLMTPTQKAALDGLVATGGSTNLGVDSITSTNLDVTSDNGTDATLPAATINLAGLMTAADKAKLDGLGQTIDFQGNVDLTDSGTIPSAADGDAYVNTENGVADAGWAAVANPLTAGEAVSAGDLVIYDGTDWAYVPTGGTQYTDEDVDAHLNTATATAGQILSFDGNDYDWVDPSATVSLGDTPPEPATEDNEGDLWWNTADGRLYISYTDIGNDSAWVDASPAGGTDGGANVTVAPLAPAPAVEGDLWYNSNDGRLYVYYVDSDSSQWVDASPAAENGGEGSGGGIPTLEQVTLAGDTTPYKIYTASTQSGDVGNTVVTKDFLESNGGGLDLQAVTDVGNTTTNEITAAVYRTTDSNAVISQSGVTGGGSIRLTNGSADEYVPLHITNSAVETICKFTSFGDNVKIELGKSTPAITLNSNGPYLELVNNIKLDGADGSANFEGLVEVGSNALANYGAIFANNSDTQATIVSTNHGTAECVLLQADSAQAAIKVNDKEDSETGTAIINGDGSASFGTGKITLNADGSADFAGAVTTTSLSAIGGQVYIDRNLDDTNNSASLVIENNQDPTAIRLNNDGSARFAQGATFGAQVTVDGTILSGLAYNVGEGTALYPSGLVAIRNDGPKAGVFQVLKDGSTTDAHETISFDNEGFAKFAGNITLFGDNTNNTIHFENTTNFNSGITWNGANDTGFTFNDSSDSSTAKVRIQNDEVRIGTNASNDATTNIILGTDGTISGTKGASFGSGNIVLNADGTAEFGTIDTTDNTTASGEKFFPDGLIRVQRPGNGSSQSCFQSWTGNVMGFQAESDGTTYIGNTSSGANTSTSNIKLNADGSAEFANRITVGSTSYEGYGVTAYINSNDVSYAPFYAQNNGTGFNWLGYKDTTLTSSIKSDGSAVFAGTVKVGSGQIDLNADGSSFFSGNMTNNVGSATNFVLEGQQGGTQTSVIKGDGSADFKKRVNVSQDDATASLFRGTLNGNQTFQVTANGNATFGGNVISGGNAHLGAEKGSLLGYEGNCQFTVGHGSSSALRVFVEGNADPSIILAGEGSANFSNKVETIGDNAAFHVGIPKDDQKVPFNIYDTDNANTSLARILANGNAEFAGAVKTTPAINSSGIGFRVDYTDVNYTSYIGLQSETVNYAFANYDADNTELTFGVTLDGNAHFAGNVTTDGTVNGVNVANVSSALSALKTAAAASTDLDELKAAIASALTNF